MAALALARLRNCGTSSGWSPGAISILLYFLGRTPVHCGIPCDFGEIAFIEIRQMDLLRDGAVGPRVRGSESDPHGGTHGSQFPFSSLAPGWKRLSVEGS